MPRQRYQRYLAAPTTAAYAALLAAAGKRRWRSTAELLGTLGSPLKGIEYAYRRGSLLRRGRVLEALPPVALSLRESLDDPPCKVAVRLRFRVEPVADGTALRVELRYELNPAATLNARGWDRELRGHCLRLLRAVELATVQRASGSSGQNNGSNSITVTKTAAVNGTPSRK